MARVLITGSAQGLGHHAANELLQDGHDVVVHVRSEDRRETVGALLDLGAHLVVGDLAHREQVHGIARELASQEPLDAVIHNAGVYSGPSLIEVNVVAPYLLTALLERPRRLVFLTSGMHRQGRPDVQLLRSKDSRASYSDTKLLLSGLMLGVARRWSDVLVNAVDPGWVPTRMGGKHAPDDLAQGHRTQTWLAVSTDREATTSGGHWYHQRRTETHPALRGQEFAEEVLGALADMTGVPLPS